MKDTQIKKLILEAIKEHGGLCTFKAIELHIGRQCLNLQVSVPTDSKISHQIFLLEREDALYRDVNAPFEISFRLTPWGEALLSPIHKKFFYFVIYRKTNFVAFVALVVSITSLFFGDIIRSWFF